MFNLLPEQQKKNLDKEYRFRKYYIMLSFAVITLVVAAIFLLPSYIRTNIAYNAATTKKSQLQATVGKQNQVSTTALHELEAETSAINVSTSTPLSVLLKSVIADSPTGVHLKEFQFGQGTNNMLVVTGIASTRDELLAFSNNLKADPYFSNVDLPIESLAADKNASFNITLTLHS